jgi:hypothetical protein
MYDTILYPKRARTPLPEFALPPRKDITAVLDRGKLPYPNLGTRNAEIPAET